MPTTRHLFADNPADLAAAAELLRQGALVAFATETVYGLGADALNGEAVARIFAAKQRPAWDPLIVHLAGAERLAEITMISGSLQPRVDALTARFWPGPLTLLLPRNAAVPDAVTAGRELIGVRVPAHPAAAALLMLAGVPVAAPSANTFGHTSPTTGAHVLADLDGRIDAVLDAGPADIGVESTVLDPTQTPMVIYRPGAITAEQISAATGVDVIPYVPAGTDRTRPESLPSPGVGIRHYAPRARVVLSGPSPEALQKAFEESLKTTSPDQRVAVLVPLAWPFVAVGSHAMPWADWSDDAALAASLFAKMRAMDQDGVATLVCPLPEAGGLRDAIRDRLQKAARAS